MPGAATPADGKSVRVSHIDRGISPQKSFTTKCGRARSPFVIFASSWLPFGHSITSLAPGRLQHAGKCLQFPHQRRHKMASSQRRAEQ